MNVGLDSNLRHMALSGALRVRMKTFVKYRKKYVTHLIRNATTFPPAKNWQVN